MRSLEDTLTKLLLTPIKWLGEYPTIGCLIITLSTICCCGVATACIVILFEQ